MIAFLVTIARIFGSDVSESKSFSKITNRLITVANFPSNFSDLLFPDPDSAADLNASSAATNTLFIYKLVEWGITWVKQKSLTFSTGRRIPSFVRELLGGLVQKIGIKR